MSEAREFTQMMCGIGFRFRLRAESTVVVVLF
jgi:hypothetical protein